MQKHDTQARRHSELTRSGRTIHDPSQARLDYATKYNVRPYLLADLEAEDVTTAVRILWSVVAVRIRYRRPNLFQSLCRSSKNTNKQLHVMSAADRQAQTLVDGL